MADNYLLTLSARDIFREYEISGEQNQVLVGTTQQCHVRFRREVFPTQFEIQCTRNPEFWVISCSSQVYALVAGNRRAQSLKLSHGDHVEIRFADSGLPVFVMELSIDFEQQRGTYDRTIDLQGINSLTLGGRNDCNLVLDSVYTIGDRLLITRQQDGFILTDQGTRYGAFCNGIRLTKPVYLRDKTFFSVAGFYFYYDAEQLRFSSKASIRFNGVPYMDDPSRRATSSYPLFNRNTRVKSKMNEEKIPVLDPPSPPSPPQGNIVVQLIPALLMIGITFGMRYFMAGTSNMSYMIMSVVMMSMGICTSVFGIISERRNYKNESARRITRYNAYIEQKRNEIQAYRDEELSVLTRRYPSLEQETKMVQEFSPDLFDRTVSDEDFLDVRLGVGLRPSVKQVDYKQQERFETDELAELPRKIYEEYYFVRNAPISVNLRKNSAIGIVGADEQLYDVLKGLVVDVATRHYPTDVKLLFMTEVKDERLIHWARGLPHVQNEILDRRNIVCDEESRNVLFEYLYKLLSDRQAVKRDANTVVLPHYVIFVVDECGIKNHPLSQFIPIASELGATFIFFEGYKEYLPQGCSQIITVERGSRNALIIKSENDRIRSEYGYEHMDDYAAWMIAQTLAPVYSEEVSLEGSLTQSYGLFEMLDIMSADDLDLGKRWSSTLVYKSMAVPLGMSKAGMVELDLSDKADGPHGLVAGTTGAGKSELLLTYLIAAATLYHPYEFAFMIIDFKGGGMAYQLRKLPHLIGTITNIDGREINRSLKSIRAELRKRQEYFAAAGVNHIDAYIRLYRSGKVNKPLPHLVIVVDEFAELKADQPEFMAELISAARIGRSLGVHLILATQKPSGQVSEQIWSNSRFKLCLKVASKEDSNEMIKSPLAAEIKEPGRAYLQVGMNERFELFQSAYGGGPEHQDDEDVHEFDIFEVENSGRRVPIYSKRRKKSDEVRTTQLDALVQRVQRYCQEAGVRQLPSICLPSLPDNIAFPAGADSENGNISIGIYDDPDRQYQGPARFDFEDSNTFIIGSSQTGKTNLLEVIVRSIAETTTPAESNIYIMDFGSMIMRKFEGLAHVGGVVISSEDERFKNLMKLLAGELAERKSRLLSAGVSSFAAYREAGYTDLPHIFVVMDNFAVFRELYAEQYGDDLISFCRDGLTYGVSFIVTNPTTSGFGYRYMANFSNHIAFECNDASEYSAVFDRCNIEPKGVPGRALCSFDKETFEFQTYLGFEGEREVDRSKSIDEFKAHINAKYPDMQARMIPSVPDNLTLSYIDKYYGTKPGRLALALSYETVEPVEIDLASDFQLALVGNRGEMRKRYVKSFIEAIERKLDPMDFVCDLHIVDNLRRDLEEYESKSSFVMSYTSDYSEVEHLVEDVYDRFSSRVEQVRTGGVGMMDFESYIVVIINSSDAIKAISNNRELVDHYKEMASQAEGMRIFFLFADVANEAVSFNGPEVLKNIRDKRCCVLFNNASEQKFVDIPGAQQRQYRTPLEDGQAFVAISSGIDKIRFAMGS